MADITGPFKRFGNFVRDTRVELKKVAWPNKQEVIGTTGVVLVVTLVFTVFFYVVDLVLSRAITSLFS